MFEAIVQLPLPLPVEPDVLGLQVRTRIAQESVDITFHDPAADPTLPVLRSINGTFDNDIPLSEDDLKDLDSYTSEWLRLVLDWAFARIGLGITRDFRYAPVITLLDTHGDPFGRVEEDYKIVGYAGGGGMVSRSQMIDAAYRATEAIELPPEHSLLLQARNAYAGFEHRLAVLNACSAAEVAFTETVRATLSGMHPDTFGGWVERHTHGIRALDEVVRSLGIESPSPAGAVESWPDSATLPPMKGGRLSEGTPRGAWVRRLLSWTVCAHYQCPVMALPEVIHQQSSGDGVAAAKRFRRRPRRRGRIE